MKIKPTEKQMQDAKSMYESLDGSEVIIMSSSSKVFTGKKLHYDVMEDLSIQTLLNCKFYIKLNVAMDAANRLINIEDDLFFPSYKEMLRREISLTSA